MQGANNIVYNMHKTFQQLHRREARSAVKTTYSSHTFPMKSLQLEGSHWLLCKEARKKGKGCLEHSSIELNLQTFSKPLPLSEGKKKKKKKSTLDESLFLMFTIGSQ